MQSVIAKCSRIRTWKMNRRQLIQSLSLAAVRRPGWRGGQGRGKRSSPLRQPHLYSVNDYKKVATSMWISWG